MTCLFGKTRGINVVRGFSTRRVCRFVGSQDDFKLCSFVWAAASSLRAESFRSGARLGRCSGPELRTTGKLEPQWPWWRADFQVEKEKVSANPRLKIGVRFGLGDAFVIFPQSSFEERQPGLMRMSDDGSRNIKKVRFGVDILHLHRLSTATSR